MRMKSRPKKFNVGQMKHRVTFQRWSSIPDEVGGAYKEYSTWRTIWAAVRSQPGNSEIERNLHRENITTKTFIVRYNSQINTKMRIKHDGGNYDIKSMYRVNETNQYLIILAAARMEEGLK